MPIKYIFSCICMLYLTERSNKYSRAKFKGWDDVIPVDYTRTSESVQRRGVDLKVKRQRECFSCVSVRPVF